MKKWKLLPAAALLLMTNLVYSQNVQGIQFFKGSWEEAKEKAKTEHKLIFLDCYTEWCGPCKVLAKDVFTQKSVGDYYNAHFVNVSMDMETDLGKKLSRVYDIANFPTLLYLKPGGYKLDGLYGLQKPEELVQKATEASALRDSVTMEELFDEGGYKDTAFLRRFFYYAYNNSFNGAQNALNRIIKHEGYNAMLQPKYWEWVGVAATGEDAGLYFVHHYQQFQKAFGEEAVKNKLADMYFNIRRLNMYRDEYAKDTAVYTHFKARMQERGLPDLPFFFALADFYSACCYGNVSAGMKNANAALKNAKSWQLYQFARLADWMLIADKENRLMAAQWASRAATLSKSAALKKDCLLIQQNLKTQPGPVVIPSPKIYGVNL